MPLLGRGLLALPADINDSRRILRPLISNLVTPVDRRQALLARHLRVVACRDPLDLSPVGRFLVSRIAYDHAVGVKGMEVAFLSLVPNHSSILKMGRWSLGCAFDEPAASRSGLTPGITRTHNRDYTQVLHERHANSGRVHAFVRLPSVCNELLFACFTLIENQYLSSCIRFHI